MPSYYSIVVACLIAQTCAGMVTDKDVNWFRALIIALMWPVILAISIFWMAGWKTPAATAILWLKKYT
jgi:hypothetical protein